MLRSVTVIHAIYRKDIILWPVQIYLRNVTSPRPSGWEPLIYGIECPSWIDKRGTNHLTTFKYILPITGVS